MITVIKHDNDGHKYKIPAEMEAEFDLLFNHYIEQEEYSAEYFDAESAFIDAFGNCMIG